MSSEHQTQPGTGARIALGGAVGLLFGLIAFGMRYQLSAMFLGADFFLGMPITRADSSKLFLVAGYTLTVIAASVQLIISGAVISFMQAAKKQKTATGDEPLPVSR